MIHTIQDGIEGKICTLCKQWRPVSEFYKNKAAPDGLQYHCKECSSALHKAYRATEHGLALCRAGEKRYAQSERGKETKRQYAKSGGAAKVKRRYHSTEKGKQSRRRSAKTWQNKNPIKKKAASAVRCAVIKGELPMITSCACIDCGTQAEEYHHESYKQERWLDVVPLCRKCHLTRHGRDVS